MEIACLTFPDRGAVICDADEVVVGWQGRELDSDSFGFYLHMNVCRGDDDDLTISVAQRRSRRSFSNGCDRYRSVPQGKESDGPRLPKPCCAGAPGRAKCPGVCPLVR